MTHIFLTPRACLDLQWIIDNILFYNRVSISPFAPSVISSRGWRACCDSCNTGDPWSVTETRFHINYLETFVTFFALKCFALDLRSTRVQLLIGYTAAVYYINNMGGT